LLFTEAAVAVQKFYGLRQKNWRHSERENSAIVFALHEMQSY
jgi:hypothetical protein